jgi:hypothetical protein
MRDLTSEDFKRRIRHSLMDNHIMVETLLNNLISNYFCESEELSREFLFLVMQKEYRFERKRRLLEELKLYEKKFIHCSKKQYKKGLKMIKWVNDKRNELAHNFIFLDNDKRKIMVNVVKSGKVKRLEITRGFLKELDKNVKGAISFLSGLNLDIASHKGLIKDGSGNIV